MRYTSPYGETYNLTFETARYRQFKNLAINAVCDDGEPYCTVSVNIDNLPDPYFAYDENNGEELLTRMIEEGLVAATGTYLSSGYCVYPVCKWLGKIPE